VNIVSVNELPQKIVLDFFNLHWGSPLMVISSGVYNCSELDGFAVIKDDVVIGLITYVVKNGECEIISLDSIEEGKGIGTLLVNEVESLAISRKVKLLKLITTNDNLSALKFYQKRGFILAKIFNNAVEKARKVKPEIPFIGNDGIPIRDEIELVKYLQVRSGN